MVKRTLSIIIAFLLIPFIWGIDIITGTELSFSIFYLFPIIFVAWYVGTKLGFVVVLTSALFWFSSELITRQFNVGLFVLLWNTGIRLGYFMVSLYFVSVLKKELNMKKELSKIDFLTGIPNYKSFLEIAGIEKSRCLRNNASFTIAYLDCDYFKLVNDTFGHRKGDEVLKIIAKAIKSNIRITDAVARVSGDKFLILFSEAKQGTAKQVVTRVHNYLLEIMKKNNWPLTFSFGVATFAKPLDSIDEMIARADSLMFSAKESGRNLIRYAEFE